MNERFFELPQEKRRRMMNAGYRVFARNSYKKSPMSEIADAAGISKALLFHYFGNKKGLYLFLWETCARMTQEALVRARCYEQEDVFDIMCAGLRAKAALMRKYPDMGMFAIKAYYEKNPEVAPQIQASIAREGAFAIQSPQLRLDPARFVPGLDLEKMYQDMYWASEGYVWELSMRGEVDVERFEREFAGMIDFWRSVYLRKEG